MVVEIPDALRNDEFAFVLVKAHDKKAIEVGWTTKIHRYNDPILLEHLTKGGNYGVLCGHKNLLVVDFDSQEVQNEVCLKLPETFTVLTGSGKLHKYFRCGDGISFSVNDSDNNRLADIQWKGKQVIAPGSVHPNGNIYTIYDAHPIANIELGELKALFSKWKVDDAEKPKKSGVWIPVKTKVGSVADLIKARLPISRILSSYGISVDKNPTQCPLHTSKGGKCLSFDDGKGLWHCFHCNKSGSVIDLHMLKENAQFNDAMGALATLTGLADQFSTEKENWTRKQEKKDSRPEIVLPGTGKLISDFASQVVQYIKDKHELFYRYREFCVQKLEMMPVKDFDKKKKIEILGFKAISPSELVTYCEKYIVPGIVYFDKSVHQDVFEPESIPANTAKTIMDSEIFKSNLPLIDVIYEAPIPILTDGVLAFPSEGYDERFQSWLPYDSPKIDTNISLEDGKKLISFIYAEFCFETEQDRTNAIAALLTSFIRGLYVRPACRTPIFFYKANREGSGKDYCAKIPPLVIQGVANSEAPLSDGKETHDEEFRKKILATFRMGKNRLHIENNKGFLNSAVLESISTTENFSDRVLGTNTSLTFPNTLELSLSANTGITYTPDLVRRCVFINLFLDLEDPKQRKFERPDLHGWVQSHRGQILSALYSLVKNWHDMGMPSGKILFASFPEWARVCGGIMEAAGYNSPCIMTDNSDSIGGDIETRDMKLLFEAAYKRWGSQFVLKRDVMGALSDTNQEDFREIFQWIDWSNEHAARIKIGLLIEKYVGRIFSDIRLTRVKSANTTRSQYSWVKIQKNQEIQGSQGVGVVGVVGVSQPDTLDACAYTTESPNILQGLKHLQHLQHIQGITEEVVEEVQQDTEIHTSDFDKKIPNQFSDSQKDLQHLQGLQPVQNNLSDIDIQKYILDLLKTYPEGITQWLLLTKMLGKSSQESIEKALANLKQSGEIYEPRSGLIFLRG